MYSLLVHFRTTVCMSVYNNYCLQTEYAYYWNLDIINVKCAV